MRGCTQYLIGPLKECNDEEGGRFIDSQEQAILNATNYLCRNDGNRVFSKFFHCIVPFVF